MAGSEAAEWAVPPDASFGARTLAVLIDGFLGLLAVAPAVLVLLLGPTHEASCNVDGQLQACTQPTSGTFTTAAALFGIGAVGYLLWYSRRAGVLHSIGQRAAAVQVVDVATISPVGWWRIFERQLAKVLSAIPLGLGFWWMLWDPRHQTWHDKLAKTIVIRTRPGGPIPPPPS